MEKQVIIDVQNSWKIVETIAPQAAALFYSNLFEANPELKALFKSDMTEQGSKLTKMISTAVSKLEQLDVLVPVLQNLAKGHVNYGVKSEHYAMVGGALLLTLEQGLGEAFTPQVRSSWEQVYGVMSDVMIDAAYEQA